MLDNPFDFVNNIDPLLAKIILENGYIAINDADSIRTFCEEIIEKESDKVSAYRKGKTKILGYFVAEVMKRTNSGADPEITTKILEEILGTAR